MVQRGRREVELGRVAGVGGVVGSRFDHDDEDDQVVFFSDLTGPGCVLGGCDGMDQCSLCGRGRRIRGLV